MKRRVHRHAKVGLHESIAAQRGLRFGNAGSVRATDVTLKGVEQAIRAVSVARRPPNRKLACGVEKLPTHR
jgi:hypothetical protein